MKYYIIGIFFCLIGNSCSNKVKEYSNTRKSIYSSQDSILEIESMENYSYKTKSVLTSVNSKEIISDLEAHTKIRNWLDNMIYPPRFFTFDNKYVFIKSMVKNPTGLDTDFYHWLVIRQPDKYIVGEIVSLSGNVNNFFKKNGTIHILSFDYGDDFFFHETSDTIPIKQQEYTLEDSLILQRTSNFLIKINER